eukprot:TRINITY_DN2805_c0_g1_i1.p1 TRINITY_DN2805_c0_g1~~TRINITY_DN2805_c0_g1_i1.p1  ORF type:complete len:1088 (+),score=366.27 TRINITY_DN2805_c0_g1_i1:48-3266(+)
MDRDLERLLGSEDADKQQFYSELGSKTPWRERPQDESDDDSDVVSEASEDVGRRQVTLHASAFSGATIGEVIGSPKQSRERPLESEVLRRGPRLSQATAMSDSFPAQTPPLSPVLPVPRTRGTQGRRSGSVGGRGSAESPWTYSSVSSAGPAQQRARAPAAPVGGGPGEQGPRDDTPGSDAPPTTVQELIGSPVEVARSPSSSLGTGTGTSMGTGTLGDRLATMRAEREAAKKRSEDRKREEETRKAERKVEQAAAAMRRAEVRRTEREELESERTASSLPVASPATPVVPEESLPTLSPDSSNARPPPSSVPALSSATAARRSGSETLATPTLPTVQAACQRCPVLEEARQLAETRYSDKARELRALHEQYGQMTVSHEQLRQREAKHSVELTDAHARRAEAEEQAAQLTAEVHRLGAALEGRSVRSAVGSGQMEYLPKDQLEALRREIHAQDNELRGLNEDNRLKAEELKDLRQQTRALREELEESSRQRSRASATGAVEGQSQVVRDLTRESNRLKEQLRVQQQEHEVEVSALRQARAQLERRLESVDWQKSQDDDLKIRDLQSQLQKTSAEHEREKAELTAKLTWYIENQELLTKHDELVRQQTNEIEALKGRVVELDTGMSKNPKRISTEKYIAELQRKVKALEEVVKSKNPNSIAELIRACKPTDTELMGYRVMQEELAQAKQDLHDKEQDHKKSIRELRQNSDRLRLDYERRLRAQEDEMKIKVREATSTRVKEQQRTLEDTRGYYTKKVKDLEQQILGMRKWAKQKGFSLPGKAPSAPAPAEGGAERGRGAPTASAPVHSATTDVQTDITIRPADPGLGLMQGGMQGGIPPGMGPHLGMPGMMYGGGMPYVSMMQQLDMGHLTQEVSRLRGEAEAQKKVEREQAADLSRMQQHCAAADRERDQMGAELARLQQHAGGLQAQLDDAVRKHTAELQKAVDQKQEALTEQRREWEADVKRLEQLAREREFSAPVRRTDQLEYLRAVKEQLQTVERRHALRESEMARALDEARRMADRTLEVQRQKMDLVVQSKNNDLDRIRLQLDGLLGEMEVLRERHVGAPIAGSA